MKQKRNVYKRITVFVLTVCMLAWYAPEFPITGVVFEVMAADDTTAWSGNASTIQTAVNGWTGTGNEITINGTISGTLTIPANAEVTILGTAITTSGITLSIGTGATVFWNATLIRESGSGSTVTISGTDNSVGSFIVTGGEISTAGTGNALSLGVMGTSVTVNGGRISATTGSAIRGTQYVAGGSTITINGGVISATTGNAITATTATSTITVNGGAMFAQKTGFSGFVGGSSANYIIVLTSGATVTTPGNAVIIAWTGNSVTYDAGTSDELINDPVGATVKWGHGSNGESGIHFKNGANEGFIPVPSVTVPLANVTASPIGGVTAPAARATPSTAINNGTDFTASLSWNGNPSVFGANTVYTATVTLTANPGYTFANHNSSGAIENFSIIDNNSDGHDPVWVSNNSTTLVFTVTFLATGAPLVVNTSDLGTITDISAIPARGAATSTVTPPSISNGANYTATGEWVSGITGGNFVGDSDDQFVYIISLTPAAGYTFNGSDIDNNAFFPKATGIGIGFEGTEIMLIAIEYDFDKTPINSADLGSITITDIVGIPYRGAAINSVTPPSVISGNTALYTADGFWLEAEGEPGYFHSGVSTVCYVIELIPTNPYEFTFRGTDIDANYFSSSFPTAFYYDVGCEGGVLIILFLYPLPAPPLTISTEPQNQTALAGDTATFSVTASGGETPYAYQWQMNSGGGWANLPGATNSSYTTSATVLTENGYQFRCRVTDNEGTIVTSDAATLTVTTCSHNWSAWAASGSACERTCSSTCGTTETHTTNSDNFNDTNCAMESWCLGCDRVLVNFTSHNFGGALVYDATNHWQGCQNNNCITKSTQTAHAASNQAAVNADCTVALVCSCGYEMAAGASNHATHSSYNANCNNAVLCGNNGTCTHVVLSAQTGHTGTAGSDCTVAVICTRGGCDMPAVAAFGIHVGTATNDCMVAVTCTRTNCTQTAIAASGGHSWDSGTPEAGKVCGETADIIHNCTVTTCTQIDTVAGTMIDHIYGNWGSNNNATCTADGTETRTCTRSGCPTPADSRTETGTALGHTPKATNCTECDRCGLTGVTGVSAVHATHTNYNGNCNTAVLCGNNSSCTHVVLAAQSGHTGTAGNDCTVAVICTENGCNQEAIAAQTSHAGTPANDCTQAVSCTRTNCTQMAIAANATHTWDSGTPEAGKVCGETADFTHNCTVSTCTQTSISTGGTVTHIFPTTWTSNNDADCLTDGTESRTCTRSGCPTSDTTRTQTQTAVGSAGHVFTTYTGNTATCTAAGTETANCDRAACSVTDSKPTTALGHDLPVAWTVRTQATCVIAGEEYKQCSRFAVCSHEVTQPITALGHDLPVAWTVRTQATCVIAGEEYKQCSRFAVCSHEVTQPITALGHNLPAIWTLRTPATCGVAGEEFKQCSRFAVCSHEATQPITALAHTWVTNNEGEHYCATANGCGTSNETCSPNGLGDTCLKCGYVTPDPTCLHAGTIVTLNPAPSCVANGSEVITCNNCLGIITVTDIPALGHSFGEWIVTTVVEETRTCTRSGCSETETRPIPILPSSDCDVISVITPQGATVSGVTIRANVTNGVTNQAIAVTVSAGASWELFSNEACTQEIANLSMNLSIIGENRAYLKVTAEDGETFKVYTIIITRAGSSNNGSYQGNNNNNSDNTTTRTSTTTITAVGGTAISYRLSNGNATLSLSTNTINTIIQNANNNNGIAFFDLSTVAGAISAALPKTALNQFANAEIILEIILPQGTVTIDAQAAASAVSQANGTNITVSINAVDASALTAAQAALISTGDLVFEITIMSGAQAITNFDGAITITVPYNGETPVGVWKVLTDGTLQEYEATFDAETVSFTVNSLSVFRIGHIAATAPGNITILSFVIGSTAFTNNGVTMSIEAAPFIDPATDRTMVPLRAIAEGLGATVEWNGETRTVTITQNGTSVSLVINTPLPDGMGTAVIVNERTFVPVRYVSEILGATVEWDAAQKAVIIFQ